MRAVAFAACLATSTTLSHAQPPMTPRADVPTPVVRGWVFTPSLAYGLSWDDNILIQGRGEDTRWDVMNAVSPRGGLDYRDRRTTFSAAYDGTILLYSRIRDLNAYDQRGTLSARRLLSPRLTVVADGNLAISPTTELTEIIGVPFIRTGARIGGIRGGVEAILSRSTVLTAAYTAQAVSFRRGQQEAANALRGGHSQGGTAGVRHRLSARTALTADYDFQHATLTGPVDPAAPTGTSGAGVPGADDTFDIHNGAVGVERRDSRLFTYSAALGISRLGVSSAGPARTGPMWRLGLSRQFERSVLDLGYSRSFVPSYGFGGTVQNEQLTAQARAPLARRLSGHASVSWRRNEPLTLDDPALWSWWIEGGVAYMLRPWLHMDAFYSTDRQRIDRPGGAIARNRIGLQLATGRAVRIH